MNRINKFCRNIKNIAAHSYVYLQALRYRIQGCHVGNPFRVYRISPDKIQYTVYPSDLSSSIQGFNIIDERWLDDLVRFETHSVYRMLNEHFVHQVPWEETERYCRMKNIFDNGGSTPFLDVPAEEQTLDMYHEYLEYVDDLYYTIRSEGYRSQSELSAESNFVNDKFNSSLNEIQVMIASDGTICHHYGAHRLSIAKILDVDSIPVRTRVRNSKWQQIRDEMAEANSPSEIDSSIKKHTSHPDLGDIQFS